MPTEPLERRIVLDRLPAASLAALELVLSIERFRRKYGGLLTEPDQLTNETLGLVQQDLLIYADVWDRG